MERETTNTTLYYTFKDRFTSFSLRPATGKYTVCGPLAQLAEQRTFNPWVVGSSPTGPTAGTGYSWQPKPCMVTPRTESMDSMTHSAEQSNTTLDDLGQRYKTDKSSLEHNYLDAYEKLVPFQREDVFTFLEIGVFRGASARMWAEWFYNATVVGIDLKLPKLTSPPKNLKLVTGDATQAPTVNRLKKKYSAPSVVLDDGSHRWNQQRESFRLIWPWLEPHGAYIVEDLHSSSEAGFTGDDIFPFVDTLLRIATFLQLRDSRREHFLSVSPPWFADILTEVASITFIESSAIIIKK